MCAAAGGSNVRMTQQLPNLVETSARVDQERGVLRQGYVAHFSSLGFRIMPRLLVPVDVLPLSIQLLALARAGVNEKQHNVLKHLALTLPYGFQQSVGLLVTEISLNAIFVAQVFYLLDRINFKTMHFPLQGQVKTVAQKHQSSIASARREALRLHQLHKGGDIWGRHNAHVLLAQLGGHSLEIVFSVKLDKKLIAFI